jgi:hypothetical protein
MIYDLNPIPENSFKIKFEGSLNDINALTFLSSIKNINELLQEINLELNKKNSIENKLEIRIKALEKGSFIANIQLIETIAENLFTPEGIAYTSGVVTIMTGIFSIRKFLKSKKPSKIEQSDNKTVKITNNKGNILIIENITFDMYDKNPKINNAIGQTFSGLKQDKNISGFELKDKDNNTIFETKDFEFEELSETIEILEDDRKIISELATLNIIKVCFEPNIKWQFYYKGMKISTNILDENFYKKINEGEKFSKGDTLEVELTIKQEFDKTVNTFVNKNYDVVRIIKHIPRNEQLSLY